MSVHSWITPRGGYLKGGISCCFLKFMLVFEISTKHVLGGTFDTAAQVYKH